MHRGLVITLAASTKSATDRACSSRIVENADTDLRDATCAVTGRIATTASRPTAMLSRESLVMVNLLA
jgi:hypothetical protein